VCAWKAESAKDGVGVADSNYLARLAKSLEIYSEQITDVDRNWTNVTGWRGNALRLGASNVAAVVRGVRALASARSAFTDTPCSYSEIRVRFILCFVSVVGRQTWTAVAEAVIIIWPLYVRYGCGARMLEEPMAGSVGLIRLAW